MTNSASHKDRASHKDPGVEGKNRSGKGLVRLLVSGSGPSSAPQQILRLITELRATTCRYHIARVINRFLIFYLTPLLPGPGILTKSRLAI